MKIVIDLILLLLISNAYSNPLPPYLSALLPPELPYKDQNDQESPQQFCFTIFSNDDRPGENFVEFNLNGKKIDAALLESHFRITDRHSHESYESQSRKRSQMGYSPPSTSYGIPVNLPSRSFKEIFMKNLVPPGTSYGVVIGPLKKYEEFDETEKNVIKPTDSSYTRPNSFEDTLNNVDSVPDVPGSLPAEKSNQIPAILSEFFKSKEFKEINSSAYYRPSTTANGVPETDPTNFQLPRKSNLYERNTFSYDDTVTTAPVKYYDSYGLPAEKY